MKPPAGPRRETRAMLDRKPTRPRSLGSFHDMPVEEELAITRIVAARLWRLLERRHPTIVVDLLEDAAEEMVAAADRCLEAALILQSRDRIRVEPCRQLLDVQRDNTRYYVLTRPGADPEVIDEERLLLMAGLPTEDLDR